MTQFFGIFCKKCGSYKIKIYISPAKECIFVCKDCDRTESFKDVEML